MTRWCFHHKTVVVIAYLAVIMAVYLSLCMNGH